MAYFNFHKCFCGSRNSAPPVPTPITAAQFAAAALFWDIVHHNKFCRELISLLDLSIKSGNGRWDYFIKFAKNYRKKRNRRKRNTKHMALDGILTVQKQEEVLRGRVSSEVYRRRWPERNFRNGQRLRTLSLHMFWLNGVCTYLPHARITIL